MTRAEKVAEALRLSVQGCSRSEIAERMGVKRKTVSDWFNDPDLAKQRERRKRYSTPCQDCGRLTDGSGGYAVQRLRCDACNQARNAGRNQRIVEAWERGDTARAIGEREGMDHRAVATLVDRLRQRGITAVVHRRRDRELWPLIEKRVKAGASPQEIADECDTNANNIWVMMSTMRRCGVDLPYMRDRVG